MVEGTQAQAAGRSIRELERLRDDYLVAIQQVLRQFDIGAGSTLRLLEERLYKDASAANATNSANAANSVNAANAELLRLDMVVRPEWTDYNNHLSDFQYGHLFGCALDALYRRVGIDAEYRAAGRMFYTVESHVKHFGEAKIGDAVYVTTQVMNVDDKRLHLFHRLRRRGDDKLLATGEQMHLHVDTGSAKAAPIDAAVRIKLDALRAAHAALPIPREAGKPVGSRAQR
jgi:carnitine 3-dehydrogenase